MFLILYFARLSNSSHLLVLKVRFISKLHYCKQAHFCTHNNNDELIHTTNTSTLTPYKLIFHLTHIQSHSLNTGPNIITTHLPLYKQINLHRILWVLSPVMLYTRVNHEKHLSLTIFKNG